MSAGNGRFTGALRRGLPYADNVSAVLLTAAVNFICVFIFYYGRKIGLFGVLADAFFCGVITPFINVFYIARRVDALRKEGALPAVLPVSRPMMRLPKNRFMLALFFAALFGAATPLLTMALIKVYGITQFWFAQMAVWKIFYSCALSAKIVELTILRYVQPDCAAPAAPPQRGAGEVKEPLPRPAVFKEWFNSATDDFGFNMLIGLALGGTAIEGYNVVVLPTVRSGIAVTSVIMGLIVAARMAYPVAKSVRAACAGAAGAAAASENAPAKGLLRLIPAAPWKFALALALPIILVSYAVFWSVMTFFHFETLNFFQFYLIRVVFMSLLSKAVARLAVLRCLHGAA